MHGSEAAEPAFLALPIGWLWDAHLGEERAQGGLSGSPSPPAPWGLQAVELEGAAHTLVSMISQHVPRERASYAAAWKGEGSGAWEAHVEEVNWAHLAGFRGTMSGTRQQLPLPGPRCTLFNMHGGPERHAWTREAISLPSPGYIWLGRNILVCLTGSQPFTLNLVVPKQAGTWQGHPGKGADQSEGAKARRGEGRTEQGGTS